MAIEGRVDSVDVGGCFGRGSLLRRAYKSQAVEIRAVKPSLFRWLFGAVGAGAVVTLAWWALTTDWYLLSALAVAWFAGIAAVYTQRDALPLFEQGGRWGGSFAGVLTYVTIAIQQTLPVSPDRAFATSLTVFGLAIFAAGTGSALTQSKASGESDHRE